MLKNYEVLHPAKLVQNFHSFNFHPARHELYPKNRIYEFYDPNDAERFVKEVGADVAEIVKEK